MNEEHLLTLRCPKCARIVEVVAVEGSFVCLECGWQFDPSVAARLLGRDALPAAATPPATGPSLPP